jgi:hypothetical protein
VHDHPYTSYDYHSAHMGAVSSILKGPHQKPLVSARDASKHDWALEEVTLLEDTQPGSAHSMHYDVQQQRSCKPDPSPGLTRDEEHDWSIRHITFVLVLLACTVSTSLGVLVLVASLPNQYVATYPSVNYAVP